MQTEQMIADVKREHAAAWRDEVRPNLGPTHREICEWEECPMNEEAWVQPAELLRLKEAEAKLAEVEAFCRDYPRTAKYPDYEGGYESALDDVLEVIAAAVHRGPQDEEAADDC